MTTLKLKLKGIERNVATAGKTATAWYRLPAQRWSWRSEAERDGLVLAAAQRYAELINHRVHVRVTSRPSTPAQWKARLAARTIAPLPGWDEHLARCATRLETLDLAEKQVFVGVDVQRSSSRWFGALWQTQEVDDLDAIMAGPGFDGHPATADEIEWLLRASTVLGHTPEGTSGVDGPWEETDLAEVTGAQWSAEPYQRSVKVVHEGVERFDVVSVIGRMQTLDSNDPWLCRTDRLPYPVEIAATFDVLPTEAVLSAARKALLRAKNQTDHYLEHHRDPPHGLEAARSRALDIQNELEQGESELSTRVEGWIRLVVSGATEKEALERAKEVERRYAPKVTIHRPSAQYDMAKEFIPGEPVACVSYKRQMPVTTAAGAMPQVTAAVGHQSGFYIGHTAGASGKQAAFWDLWRSTEILEQSGLAVILGALGCGKSWLTGTLAYQAAMSGARCTLFDPSDAGLLANLCYLPELVDRALHIDLLHTQTPGQLNPWTLVADPRPEHYDDVVHYDHAVKLAASARRTLAVDGVAMLLPEAPTKAERYALHKAARIADVADRPSPRLMIDALHTFEPDLADFIREDVALLPAAGVMFDTGTDMDYHAAADAPILTVITLSGIQVPREGSTRADWTTEERLGLVRLNYCAWLAQRSIYQGDRHERKFIAFDEYHALSLIPSGLLLMNTSARDSRKFNVRVTASTHSGSDVTKAGIGNLVNSVFVGQTEDPTAQREALELLRAPQGCGFEPALATLAPDMRGSTGRSGRRDFVWADGEGGIERVTIDRQALPAHVQEALDSTADSTKAKVPVG